MKITIKYREGHTDVFYCISPYHNPKPVNGALTFVDEYNKAIGIPLDLIAKYEVE